MTCDHQWVRRPDLDESMELAFVCDCGARGRKLFGSKEPIVESDDKVDAEEAELEAYQRARYAGVWVQSPDGLFLSRGDDDE